MKSFFKLVVLAVTAIASMYPQWARAQFSGSGSGTENDPYLIFNPIQLNEVRNYLDNSDVWFKMMYDVDLVQWLADNNPTQGWQPIGNSTSQFKGHFLGNGHKITGITINRSTTNYIGFFGCTDGATISNLIIEGQSINGADYVGGLVGLAMNTSFTSCSINGGNVNGANKIGGLAGQSQSSIITDCFVSAHINATGSYSSLCVGYGNGLSVTRLKGNGHITGIAYTGGVIGYNTSNATTITNSSVEGKVFGTSNVAGIVGYSRSSLSISSSNFFGEVTGTSDNVGGLVGYSYNAKLNINNSYVIADVSGKAATGGLIGKHGGCDNVDINDIIPTASSSTTSVICSIGDTTYWTGYTIVYRSFNNSTGKYTYTLYPTKNVRFSDSSTSYSVGSVTAWPGYVIVVKGKSGASGSYYYYYIVVSTNDVNNFVNNGNIILNNYCNGTVSGTSEVGGLIGETNINAIRYNYCYGSITGTNNVGGLLGKLSGVVVKLNINGSLYNYQTYSFLESNVAVVETVNATQSNVGRIYGSVGDYVTIGINGTATENKGLATSKVTLNGLQQELPDNQQQGTNVGNATLKLRATYQGIGWDFSNWQILETESYPYKQGQCAPPVIYDLVSGSTVVSGKSTNGSTVYLTIDDMQYSTETNANLWSISVPPLQAGNVVKAYAVSDDLEHSYYTKQTVRFKGNGTEAEPYEIYTASDLNNINSYSYYKLMNDIDLSEWIQTNSPTTGWVPIGLSGGGSMHQLDGDGHKVMGLWSNASTDFYGLIASTHGATICNLSIYTADGKKLKGGNNTGIVVGKAENTTFNNVTVNGDVQGNDNVGGIVGYCQGNTYTNCRMNGSVEGDNFVGGLASNSSGNITSSCANVVVTGNNYVGGLVGESSSSITECYSTGTVSATNNINCYAGGITGVNNGSITDCYSAADLNSGIVDGSVANNELQQYAGGIAGYNYGAVTRCFASGNIFAVKFGGGIVGYNDGANATTSKCFAINNRIDVSNETGIAMRVIGGIKNGAPTPDANNYALKTMVVSINNEPQVIYDDLLHGFSCTLETLKHGATYSNNGWDMDNIWKIDEDESYPYLRSVNTEEAHPEIIRGDANGDGDVTITDVVLTAQFAVGKTPSNFIEANADVNGDGNINITDVVIIANIAVGKITMPRKVPTMIQDESNRLMANELSIGSGETRTIDIMLNNTIGFCGFQIDVELPEGLELVAASLSDRADSHELLMGGNQAKKQLLAFSLGNDVFYGTEGTILSMTVKANQDYDTSEYPRLSNIFFVEPDGNTIQLNDLIITNSQSFVQEVNDADVRIYGDKGRIIIESSIVGKAQVVSTSGATQCVQIIVGRNVIPAQQGIYIVSIGNKVVKIKI